MPPLRPTLPLPLRTLLTLTTRRNHSSVSANEVTHFSALATSWWDPMGPSRVLHLMNPLRHDFIASCLSESSPPPGNTLRYLDIGCGGGIFAESLARSIPASPSSEQKATATRAASITAIDPTTTLIQIAREHARTDPGVEAHLRSGRFQYRNCSLEDLIAEGKEGRAQGEGKGQEAQYDMVTLFEVLEHIDTNATSSPLKFLTDCLRVVRPGGWLIGSTISRSFPSFLVNQVIAEAPWPVGVVPRGTHEWSKFVNPDELEGWVQEGLMRAADGRVARAGSEALSGMQWKCAGVMYLPGLGWKMVGGSEDWGNYFWAVRKGV